MRKLTFALLLLVPFFLQAQLPKELKISEMLKRAKKSIMMDSMLIRQHLYTLSADSMEGRNTATVGQYKAADYIVNYLRQAGVQPIFKDSTGNLSYLQPYPFVKKFGDRTDYFPYAHNVIGYVEGSVKKDEFLVISAHYDHLGIRKDSIYNGADDNGTGTSMVLELARIFAQSAANGERPYRSILFVFFSGEEKGLLGSAYFAENPVVPLKQCVADLNIDMVGRWDTAHIGNDNYLYLIGSDKLSKDLHRLSEKTNRACCKMELDYTFNDPKDPQRLYYRSDHYNFAKYDVPVIFYFSGLHEDYHRPSDDPEKINIQLLMKRMNLILATAHAISSREERIVVDEDKKVAD